MLNPKEDPVSEYLRKMAQYFHAELSQGNDASTITMDNEKGKGFISVYRIFDGVSVWAYNITFFSDFKLEYEISEHSPYYFSYNVKGDFLHRMKDQKEFVKVLQNQNMIVVGSSRASVEIIFPANVKLEIAIVVVDLNLLGNQEKRNAKRIHSKIQNIFQKIPKDRAYRHLGSIDIETEKYASIVCENNNVDLIGELLTEGAVLNMLASQLKAYGEESFLIDTMPKLSREELSKITSLGAYILDNLKTKITIQKLSVVLGLSPKKLQIGVQYLYGDTVGHYILNLRMGHAKHLFSTTELNVSEVCHLIGLSSPSYFSKVFKERYGLSPSSYRHRND